jgi:hypothetical protein
VSPRTSALAANCALLAEPAPTAPDSGTIKSRAVMAILGIIAPLLGIS